MALTSDQQWATNWGRSKGVLSGNETATGGLLDSRLAKNPSLNNQYRGELSNFRSTSGVRPTNVASQNTYQQNALVKMGEGAQFDANRFIPVQQGQTDALKKASAAYDGLSTPYKSYDQSTYKQFMNPYIAEVIDNNSAAARRREAERRTGINESFAEAGGFGSTALGLERSRNASESERNIQEMDAAMRAQGFDMATGRNMQLYEGDRSADMQRRLSQAQGYLATAGGYSGLQDDIIERDAYGRTVNDSVLRNMLASGDRIQQQNQRELDAFYGVDAVQRQFPYTQNQFLSQILSSYPTGQQSTTSQPGVGALQGGLGGALVGSSLPWNDWFGDSTIRGSSGSSTIGRGIGNDRL
jgi:hypothetical protein